MRWRKARQRRVRAEQNRDPNWHWHRGPLRAPVTLGYVGGGQPYRVDVVFVRGALTRSRVVPDL